MKVLITGASGLLGRAIKRVLDQVADWTIVGLGYNRLDGGLRKVNLCDDSEVIAVIEEFRPDVVIHSAAERRPDHVANHADETKQLNVSASELLAKEVSKYGGFILYISTEYVFDGTSPPYMTTDQPNPLNQYGISKLEGEKAVQINAKRFGILRVPILYGEVERLNESAVTCLFEWLLNTTKTTVVTNYEPRYPTSTHDLAIVCRQIIEHLMRKEDFHGIWHWRGGEMLTKYGMVEVMARLFSLPMDHIVPNSKPPKSDVIRPYDTKLDCSDLEKIGISQRTPFEVGIKECLAPYLK